MEGGHGLHCRGESHFGFAAAGSMDTAKHCSLSKDGLGTKALRYQSISQPIQIASPLPSDIFVSANYEL